MNAIIVAGGIPEPDDPLFPYTQGRPKALIDVCGQTMLERIVAACQGNTHIEQVVVVGLDDDQGLTFARPVIYVPDHGSLLGNIRAGLEWQEQHGGGHVLALTGDIPLITTAVLDDFIASATVPLPMITYRFVTRATVEAQFPNSQRTFTRLRDAVVTQADVFILHTDLLHTNQPLWEALIAARKQPWRIARVVGLKTLLKLLLRRLAMADLEETAQRLLDAPVSVGLIPHAALAMDVDKPHHLQVVRDACTHSAEF
ncbi:MAG: NTP transferase domain-containing protein [Anaerolineae bacterium]|nr:NTP transferase domain-containing protein [Anaerolineae bacterium]